MCILMLQSLLLQVLSHLTDIHVQYASLNRIHYNTGAPSPPQNVWMKKIVNYNGTSTVIVDWDPPNGGGVVDKYIVETLPETTVKDTSDTRAMLDLSYNVSYVVRVTAENCAGNSTPPAVTDSFKLGMCLIDVINCRFL